MENNNKKNNVLSIILKLVLTIVAGVVILYGGAVLGLLLAYKDIHLYLSYVIIWGLPALLLPVIWLKQRKKYMKFWLVIALLCFIALGANVGILKYNESISIDTSDYGFRHSHELRKLYLPFEEDSKVVKIDSKTLKFTENIPKLDGADAMFPVYSAFIHAVYPDTTELYDDTFGFSQGSPHRYLSTWGYHYLSTKEYDIFFDLYPTKAGEAHADSPEAVFEYTTIGTEALVFFVHKDNPIDNLTTEQIQGIYSGEITNWSDLGGKNKKITAYQSDVESVSQLMMQRFMGDIPLMKATTKMGYGKLYGWEEQIADYKNKPNSIGFSSRYLVANNPDIKILSVDGIAPTLENIKDGSYPNVVPIYAVTLEGNTNENVDKLLDWILSDEGQYIIEESGYVGVVSEYLDELN